MKKTVLIRIHLPTHSETGAKRRNTQQLLSSGTFPYRPKTRLTKANADKRNGLRRKMAIEKLHCSFLWTAKSALDRTEALITTYTARFGILVLFSETLVHFYELLKVIFLV